MEEVVRGLASRLRLKRKLDARQPDQKERRQGAGISSEIETFRAETLGGLIEQVVRGLASRLRLKQRNDEASPQAASQSSGGWHLV